MQQLGSSARTSNTPGGLAHLLRPLRREAQLSRRHSLLGLDHGAPGWTENMTRRSLSGTMIALPRNSGSYNPRVGFDFRLFDFSTFRLFDFSTFRLFDFSTKGHTEEATTPDEPKAANMPDATPGNDNTLAWVSTTEIQLLMPQAAMNIF
ncbi:hypothetical protein E4U51_002787 [Claviceps purpurea]|nr:hypothetical protein E4U51_002787 [Claviceps purpurea]